MVNLKYVEKRKRNKIITISSLIGSVVVLTFGIISFLGQKTGSFTVNLKNSNVHLALSKTSDFKDPTSFLRVDDLEDMELYCFHNFRDSLSFDNLDNEDVNYTVGIHSDREDESKIYGYRFFKYTFFVKNIGESSAYYDMDINIISDSKDSETMKSLTSFLRVAVIDDGNATVYAQASNDATHYDVDSLDTTTKEYIDGNHDISSKYAGLAEPFVNGTQICTSRVDDFKHNDIKRYTIIFWLEGDDAEATGIAPKDAKIRLGVEIQAYEN